jgi:hypothetical protein
MASAVSGSSARKEIERLIRKTTPDSHSALGILLENVDPDLPDASVYQR